jgi:hypothetical protein
MALYAVETVKRPLYVSEDNIRTHYGHKFQRRIV